VDRADEAVERGPTSRAVCHQLSEEVWCERVVISTVSRFTDALCYASVEQAARLGAHARLAHTELLGELVERARGLTEHGRAKQSAGDTGEAVGFGREPHSFDKSFSCRHAGPSGGRLLVNSPFSMD